MSSIDEMREQVLNKIICGCSSLNFLYFGCNVYANENLIIFFGMRRIEFML